MGDRTLTYRYEDSLTKDGGPRVGWPRLSLRIERSSSGRPGLFFIIRSESKEGSVTEESVYIADGETFLDPVWEWLDDGTIPGTDVKTPAPASKQDFQSDTAKADRHIAAAEYLTSNLSEARRNGEEEKALARATALASLAQALYARAGMNR